MDVTIEVGGHRLRVRRFGQCVPDQPVLVLLHEGLGSISMWKDFPVDLCKATGLPAIVYDRYGHGGSDPLEGPRTIDFLETEASVILPELLAKEGITRPILLGHSDGGTIALLYAAAFSGSPVACVTLAAHVFFESAMEVGVTSLLKRFHAESEFRQRLSRHHRDASRLIEGWAGAWVEAGRQNWTIVEKLSAIKCPVFAIQGNCDEHGTVAHVDAIIAKGRGKAVSLMLEGIGHVPHHEARTEVVLAIARFIANLPQHNSDFRGNASCNAASS